MSAVGQDVREALSQRWAGLRERVPAPVQAVAPDVWRGVRGAVATLVPFLLASVWQQEELTWTALGGWLGTLSDPGGTRAARARVLAGFAVGGTIFVALSTAVAGDPWVAAVALGAAAFAASLLRALGAMGASLGTLLAIVFAIGIGRVGGEPLRDAAYFAAGAVWAALLSSVVWPVGTHVPVRRAVARAMRELAAYATELGAAGRASVPRYDARWSLLARTHRRRARAAIEDARQIALAVRARHPGASALGVGLRVAVALIDAQLALLVTVGEELEAAGPVERERIAHTLERVASVDVGLADAVLTRIAPRVPSIAAATGVPTGTTCARLEDAVREMTELVATIDHPRDDPSPSAELQASPRLGPALRALRDALSPRSSVFMHALRVAGAAVVAALLGRLASPAYAHWVTVTTIAVLQPFPGATYRRAIERVIGTVLGTLIAVMIAMTVHDMVVLAALMFPLSVAAVATRPRSYRLFTVFLTPVFVLLAEQSIDAPDEWQVVLARVGDAALGGLVAVVASLGVLPSWERERLPEALAKMLDALLAYERAVMMWWRDPSSAAARETLTRTRREAGIGLGNAEASLERMLAEPRRAHEAENALELVTHSRRLAGALTAIANSAVAAPPAGALDPIDEYVARTVSSAAAAQRSEPSTEALEAPVIAEGLEPIVRARLESALRYARLIAAMSAPR